MAKTPDEIIEELQDMLNGGPPLPSLTDGWHAVEFQHTTDGLKRVWNDLAGALAGIDQKFKLCNLGDKAALLVLLKAIKGSGASITKLINTIEPPLEQEMSMAISEQNMTTFQTATHTLTAKAEAYLSKAPKTPDDPGWDEMLSDPEVSELLTENIPAKALEALCRKRLAEGEELPPNVEVYIKASISLRRLSK